MLWGILMRTFSRIWICFWDDIYQNSYTSIIPKSSGEVYCNVWINVNTHTRNQIHRQVLDQLFTHIHTPNLMR